MPCLGNRLAKARIRKYAASTPIRGRSRTDSISRASGVRNGGSKKGQMGFVTSEDGSMADSFAVSWDNQLLAHPLCSVSGFAESPEPLDSQHPDPICPLNSGGGVPHTFGVPRLRGSAVGRGAIERLEINCPHASRNASLNRLKTGLQTNEKTLAAASYSPSTLPLFRQLGAPRCPLTFLNEQMSAISLAAHQKEYKDQ
jgi:hypothetical protein